jgi:hypothetical protein
MEYNSKGDVDSYNQIVDTKSLYDDLHVIEFTTRVSSDYDSVRK